MEYNCINCRFLIVCVLVGISQINGFEKPCDMSTNTAQVVDHCPTDEDDYKEAASRKNCSSINNTCESFVYHCVMNVWRNSTIEVCAPWLYIVGHVCSEYSYFFKSIRSSTRSCENFTVPCPFRYNSTEQYKVPGCYELIYKTLPKDTQRLLVGEVVGIVFAAVLFVILICLSVVFIFFVKRKMKNERKTCRQVIATLPFCGQYFTEDGIKEDRREDDIPQSLSSDRLLAPDTSNKRDHEIMEHEDTKSSERELSNVQKVNNLEENAEVSEPQQQAGSSSLMELIQLEDSPSSMPSNQISETTSNQTSCTTMTMQTNTPSASPSDSPLQDIQPSKCPLPLSDEVPNPTSTPLQLVLPQQEETFNETDSKNSIKTINSSLDHQSQTSCITQNGMSNASSNPKTEHQPSVTITAQIQSTNSLENQQINQTSPSSQNQQLETCFSTTQNQFSESAFDSPIYQQSNRSSHLLEQQENQSSSSLNQQLTLSVSTPPDQPISFNSHSLQSSSDFDDTTTNEEECPPVSRTSNSSSPSPTSTHSCNDAETRRYAQPESPDAPRENAYGESKPNLQVIKLGKSELYPSSSTPVKSKYRGSEDAHDGVYNNRMNTGNIGAHHQTDLRRENETSELSNDDPVITLNSLTEDIAPIGRTKPSVFQDGLKEDSTRIEALEGKLDTVLNIVGEMHASMSQLQLSLKNAESDLNSTKEDLQAAKKELHDAEKKFESAAEELRQTREHLQDQYQRLCEKQKEIEDLKVEVCEKDKLLCEKDRKIKEQQEDLFDKDRVIIDKDRIINEKQKQNIEKEAELAKRERELDRELRKREEEIREQRKRIRKLEDERNKKTKIVESLKEECKRKASKAESDESDEH